MKAKKTTLKSQLLVCGLLSAAFCLRAPAQGTAFTYQGRLNNGSVPVDGLYDLKFALFQNSTGGGAVLGPITNSAVSISNGLFTTLLDFGPYDPDTYGRGKWLEISVRTNGPGSLTVLGARQQMTPAPSAIFATYAGGPPPGLGFNFTNLTSFNPPAGPPFSVGTTNEVANLNVDLLDGLDSSAFWQLAGNSGINTNSQFLGTTDNKPLNLKVNGKIALQIMPGTTLPNIIGGLSAFRPSFITSGVSGAVIAGGNAPSGAVNGFGGGDFQAVYDNDGTIGGGFGNKVGNNNVDLTDAAFATVGGGVFNSASGYAATVAGGDSNVAGGGRSAVAGGTGNQAIGNLSAIGGGQNNVIQTNADHSTIAGGFGNLIQSNAVNVMIGGGNSNVVPAFASYSTIAGGYQNSAGGLESFIGGGLQNVNNGDLGIIGGGRNNLNLSIAGTIAGGQYNTNLPGPIGGLGAIGGGFGNVVTNDAATIPGGIGNVAGGFASFAAGDLAQALHDGAFVWADAQGGEFSSTAANQFLIRAGGGVGIGTPSPQGSLHVYSDNNPTVVRIQSTGTPGLGRVEFVSNPQSDANQWRPGYIQSLDAGGFTGALGFYVNGSGSGNKFGSVEVMRVVNGNVGIGITAPTNRLHVAGGVSATAFINTSDRNAKENFAPVSPETVLAKVIALPITTWNFKDLHDGRHMGPMAQDFYAAFGLGGSDTTITSVDPDGVALAAIQGLNQKLTQDLQQKDAQIAGLRQANAELKQSVDDLKRTIDAINAKLKGIRP
jgi:hypothetical protein